MCMFVICMLCTEKRKDAGGYANKTVTHMPATKKRHSTSASYSSAVSTASSNSSTTSSTGSAAYGAAAAAARLIPLGNVTCNIMGATTVPVHQHTTLLPHNTATAASAAAHIAPITPTSLASIKCNIVQKSVSPAVMFQELPPRYRAWL